jgi:hypothetical protein
MLISFSTAGDCYKISEKSKTKLRKKSREVPRHRKFFEGIIVGLRKFHFLNLIALFEKTGSSFRGEAARVRNHTFQIAITGSGCARVWG